MQKAAVALLAVPILVAVYMGALFRRSVMARIGLVVGLSGLLGVGLIGAGLPATISALPPTPIVPLTQAAFRTVVASNHDLTAPVAIAFTTPMDPGSVAASVKVNPPTPVELAWDASAQTLTVAPEAHWTPGTYYTVSVEAGALAMTGQPLARPARAAFLTRAATTGSIAPTDRIGNRVSVGTAFNVTFARPVNATTVPGAITLDPPAAGTVSATTTPTGSMTSYTFKPSKPLTAGKRYRLRVVGIIDQDGVALAPVSLAVKTTNPPAGRSSWNSTRC